MKRLLITLALLAVSTTAVAEEKVTIAEANQLWSAIANVDARLDRLNAALIETMVDLWERVEALEEACADLQIQEQSR